MEKKGALPYITYILTIFLSFNLFSAENINKISLKVMKKLKSGEIYTSVNVKSFKLNKIEMQKFELKQFGLHKKTCSIALSKISQYETFKSHISFIKNLNYDSKNKELYMKIDSVILPRPFILVLTIDRITSVGTYPFIFNGGILPGLKGNIIVSKLNNRCLFKVYAHWKGKDSGFSNLLFEMFSSTLSKLAINRIFQISQTY